MHRSNGSLEVQLYSSPRQRSSRNIFSRLFKRSPRSKLPDDSGEASVEHIDPTLHANSIPQDYHQHVADEKTVKEIFKGKNTGKDLVESLMRCVTYNQPIKANELIGPHILSAPEEVTVAEYLDDYLKQELREKNLPYLHICAFLASWTPEAENAFSFLQRLRASFGDRLHALYNSPKLAIIDCVADTWKLKPEVQEVLKGHHSPYPRYPATQLPSSNPAKTPSNILSTDGTSTILEWQILPMEYKSTLDIYVWQYHLEPPPSISVTVLVLPASSSQQRRVAIRFNPRGIKVTADTPDEERLLERFKKEALAWDRYYLVQHDWAPSHEVLRLMLVFYGWMTQDTARFVDKIGTELRAMTRRGREKPSTSKIQYLMHLDDCCRKAIEDLTHSAKMLKSLELAIHSSEFCCNQVEDKDKFLKMTRGMENDIKFLSNKVKRLAKPIDTARNEIKEQMALSSGQRTFVLTVLAALFIPLSFVSGLFGMNLSNPLFPSPSYTTVSNKTTSTSGATITTSARERVTPVIPSATATSTSSSNQHYWNAALYLEIALPLVVATIVLPLVISPLIRFSMRTAFRHRLKWRLSCAFGVLVYLGFSYGFLYWYPDYCQSDCPSFWYYNRSYSAFVLYMILVPGVLGCIAIAGLVQAFKGKRSRVSSAFFAVLVVASVFIEVFVDYPTLSSDGEAAYYNNLFTSTSIAQDWVNITPLRPIPLTWIPWAFLLAKWIFGSSSRLSSMKRRVAGLLGIRIRGRSQNPTHTNLST